MRWTPGGPSQDLEDRRGERARMPIRLGLGGMILVGVLSLLFHRNLFVLLNGSGDTSATGGGPTSNQPATQTPQEQREVQFVSFVLDDAQTNWERVFRSQGRSYQHARMVLFRDAIDSACGFAQTA